jgi:hypothetical protein
MTRVTILALLLCASAPLADAQPGRSVPLPEGTKVLKDLAYGAGGHERQKLDLYLPPTGTRSRPSRSWSAGPFATTGRRSPAPTPSRTSRRTTRRS